MANTEEKKLSTTTIYESVIGCKWSRQILFSIAQGVDRPGAMTRAIEGLTTKVQTDCLRRMTGFGIIERLSFSEVPPRVEYKLTGIGKKLLEILKQVEELQYEIEVQKKP
ncbi:MAG: helix-turn-helix domain-containing protein [Acidobacteriota bacterium]